LKIENFISCLIFIIIYACNNSVKQKKQSSDTTVIHPVDSTSKITSAWIFDTVANRTHSPYEQRTAEIEKNVRLNDSVFYVLYSVNTSVNRTEYLLSFINNRAQKEVMISEGPDADLSIPHYDFTEYKSSNDTLYEVFHYDQTVKYPEKVLTKDGQFKEGSDFENVDIKTDTTHVRIRILHNGFIVHDTIK
jgi:hypothetical protein